MPKQSALQEKVEIFDAVIQIILFFQGKTYRASIKLPRF